MMSWESKILQAITKDDDTLALHAIHTPGWQNNAVLKGVVGLRWMGMVSVGGHVLAQDGPISSLQWKFGDSFLHIAQRNGALKVYDLLLEAGVDATIQNCDGELAGSVTVAPAPTKSTVVEDEWEQVVFDALKSGSAGPLSKYLKTKNTKFLNETLKKVPGGSWFGYVAFCRKALQVCEHLKGVAWEYGDTVLHIACRNGHAGVAQVLIDAGADRKVLNSMGEMPNLNNVSLDTMREPLQQRPKTLCR